MAFDATNNTVYALDDTTAGFRRPSLELFSKIITIDPTDYPFFTLTGNSNTHNVTVEWQTRGLAARDKTNAAVEGAEYAYEDLAAPTRVSNTTQIFTKGVEVSGTAQAEAHYGVKNLMRDQIDLRSTEMKGDFEAALISGDAEAAGDATTARRMAGLEAIAGAASGQTESGGDAVLTETMFLNALKLVWNNGPKARDCMLGPNMQTVVNGFSADGATKWINTVDKEVVNMVLVYQSSFGTIRFHLSRDVKDHATDTTAQVFVFDKSYLSKVWLRRPFMAKPAVTGDYIRSNMVAEMTFKYDDDQAMAIITGIKAE